jgi:hypothetical protein
MRKLLAAVLDSAAETQDGQALGKSGHSDCVTEDENRCHGEGLC